MNEPEEVLDLVDRDDTVVGTQGRSEVMKNGGVNFRVINAFVRNSKGELWIPRRTAHKKLFPLCLDVSVGGHVGSGESYEETLRRETLEELNIDIATVRYKLLGKLSPYDHLVSAFMQVYEITLDDAPQYNKDDFLEYYWLTPHALFEALCRGEKAKGDLPPLVRKFYILPQN